MGEPDDEDYRSNVFSAFAAFAAPQDKNLARRSGRLLLGLSLDQHPHNVALLHYEILDTIDFDLGARPFAEQDAVADLDVDRDELAALVAAAGANGGNLPLLRSLLGGVRNDYATSGLCLGVDSLDDDAVVKRFIDVLLRFCQKVWRIWYANHCFESCSLWVRYFGAPSPHLS